jgi:D-glycero-alpha-D-manno-heptose-7-phosphate kinase
MIIVRTPFRVSFFGGGTDYPAWYEKHGGAVLTSTLDKYCYISARKIPPFLGSKYRVVWSKIEMVDRLEDIEHRGVRGCLQALGIEEGIEVHHAADMPARAGLGSSSAFTVGMLHALHAMRGVYAGQSQLAREAIRVEQDILHETVGVQDQIECAYGGFNHIEIARNGSHAVHRLRISPGIQDDLAGRLMLFFTGLQRYASEIAEAQVSNADRREKELAMIFGLVTDAIGAVVTGRLDDFGALLHETWKLKRRLSDKVTNQEIDVLYDQARRCGAIGGKLLGAGGGGFLLLYARPRVQDRIRAALANLLEVPFRFGHEGSRVMVCEP